MISLQIFLIALIAVISEGAVEIGDRIGWKRIGAFLISAMTLGMFMGGKG